MSEGPVGGARVLTKLAELEALEPAWRVLWERVPGATPFLSPEWILAWWRQFPEEKELAVVVVDGAEGIPRLLLPLCLMGETLMFVGTGNSDYGDVLTTDPALVPQAFAALEHVPWRCLDLQQLRPGSPILDVPGEILDGEPCPTVSLPAAVSTHFQKRLEKSWRQLAQHGPVSFRVDTNADAFATFCELHRRRWALRGESGVVDRRSRAFLWDVARAAPFARLGVLACGDRPVAAYLGFLVSGVLYSYLGGFDPELARIGIGNLLIDSAIQEARREGARVFDFLRGREAYKYRWGATDSPTRRWRRIRATA